MESRFTQNPLTNLPTHLALLVAMQPWWCPGARETKPKGVYKKKLGLKSKEQNFARCKVMSLPP